LLDFCVLTMNIAHYSPVKIDRRFGTTYRLHLQGRRVGQGRHQHDVELLPGFILQTVSNVECSSETLALLYQTVWCHVPEDCVLKALQE
jgi:hypothetical protein